MSLLFVGLGNPGLQYDCTRHNIGFEVLDHVGDVHRLNWKEKFKGVYAQGEVEGEKAFFLKPFTFMNLSGESVQPLIHFFKIEPTDIVVIHDEVDLPFGQIVLKSGGGLAGHNGLKSIAQCTGTQNFKRIRMGVGRPRHGAVSDHVLGRYNSEEDPFIEDFFTLTRQCVELMIKNGFEKASQRYSRKSVVPTE